MSERNYVSIDEVWQQACYECPDCAAHIGQYGQITHNEFHQRLDLMRVEDGVLTALDCENVVRCTCGSKYYYDVEYVTTWTEVMDDGTRVPRSSSKNIVRCVDCGDAVDAGTIELVKGGRLRG